MLKLLAVIYFQFFYYVKLSVILILWFIVLKNNESRQDETCVYIYKNKEKLYKNLKNIFNYVKIDSGNTFYTFIYVRIVDGNNVLLFKRLMYVLLPVRCSFVKFETVSFMLDF